MSEIPTIFAQMTQRYVPHRVTGPVTYYFSVGNEKWTATLTPEACAVSPGRPSGSADCVLKCDPELFSRMVLDGHRPGPFDIARGKIKTNNVHLLKSLPDFFRLGR